MLTAKCCLFAGSQLGKGYELLLWTTMSVTFNLIKLGVFPVVLTHQQTFIKGIAKSVRYQSLSTLGRLLPELPLSLGIKQPTSI